jgi:tetratricopeptide (TPR) repeat protein
MAKRKAKKSTKHTRVKKTKPAKKTAGSLTKQLRKLDKVARLQSCKATEFFKKLVLPIKFASYLAPLGLGTIVLLLAFSLALPKNRFQLAKERLAENPQDIEARLILAEEFLNNNQFKEAEKELLLAQEIERSSDRAIERSSNDVLGITTSRLEALWGKKQEADPENIRWLISQWEKVIYQQPDYRDGYLRLALYHFQLFENQKAQAYLQKALELDPNFEPTQELLQIIQ